MITVTEGSTEDTFAEAHQVIALPNTTVSLDKLRRALLTVLALPTLFVLMAFLLRTRPEVSVPGYLALAVAIAGLSLRFLPASDFRTAILYMCSFAVFNSLRTMADNTVIPVNFSYPIEIDSALFGAVPTVWLQDKFYVPGAIGPLDWIAVVVYGTYFSGHYLAALLVWAIRRNLLVQHIGAIIATLFIGLLVYYVLPTSPPWFSAQTGHLPEIFRISPIVTGNISKEIYQSGSYIAGTNDVAAMPSLHTALTAVIAMTLWRLGRVVGVIGWMYTAAMGFSLMYLGEHYFIDVVAGVVTAVAAWKLVIAIRKAHMLGWRLRSEDMASGSGEVPGLPAGKAA